MNSSGHRQDRQEPQLIAVLSVDRWPARASPRPVANLQRVERRALARLRAAHEEIARLDAIQDNPFRLLMALDHFRDGMIWASTAPHVSAGELRLLTWLAALQRRAGVTTFALDPQLVDRLQAVADALLAGNMRLPFGAVARASADAPAPAEGEDIVNLSARLRRSTGRHKAIALACSRQAVRTSDLLAVGLSRQSVARLCKDGFLERVRQGFYRAAVPT